MIFGCFPHFKSSLQLLQLFSRTLQLCFVVKVQKYFTTLHLISEQITTEY